MSTLASAFIICRTAATKLSSIVSSTAPHAVAQSEGGDRLGRSRRSARLRTLASPLDFDIAAFMLVMPLPFDVDFEFAATHYEFTTIQMFWQARYQISGEAILSP